MMHMKVVLVAALLYALAGQAVEAKPYTPTTLTLNQTAPIHHGDTITFTYSVSKPIKDSQCTELGRCPAIKVECEQAGRFMYMDIDPAWMAVFYLDSGTQPAGSPFWYPDVIANCVATLYDYRNDPSQWAAVYFDALP